MEPTSSAAGIAVQSLLSLLTEGGGRHAAALALLHQRALQVTSGRASLLFEPHPTTGRLHPTSAAGLDLLDVEPWVPAGDENALVAQAFARRAPVAVDDLARQMPALHAQLPTPHALLLPLMAEDRRVGLVAVGLTADAQPALRALTGSEVPGGFTLALELARLRQRDGFEQDLRGLLDRFAVRWTDTLDLRVTLDALCADAARLFGADSATIWTFHREQRAMQSIASSDRHAPLSDAPIRADDPLIPAAAALRTERAGLATGQSAVTATLTVPMRGYRRVLGTLVFEGVRLEPGDDLVLLNRADELGRRLAGALETTQLVGAVTDARRELEQVLDAVALPVVVLDADATIVRSNQAFATLTGRPADSLAGQPLAPLVSPPLLAWIGASRESAGPAVASFAEPGLGGHFEVVLISTLLPTQRVVKVISWRAAPGPGDRTGARRATL